jgi:sn-glycerol 3-phosphate transport system substrate-binding protein
MYFDKAAFKEAGLDANKRVWTYDEVAAAAKKLVKKDGDGKVVRHGIGFTLYSWILEQELATQGALFADPGNGRQTRARKLVFDSKAGVNWLGFLKSLIDSGSGESFGIDGGANSTARDAAFVTGEACITLNSIASLRGYIKSAKDAGKGVEVGVAYIPRPVGAPGGVIIGGASLWMTNTGTAPQQAGAWEFLKFASTPETQAFFSANTGYYPTRKAAYAVQDMKDALARYPPFQIAIDELRATAASAATQGAVFGTFVKTRSNIQGAMEQFVTGKIPTAQQALSGAAKMSTSELEEYNTMAN